MKSNLSMGEVIGIVKSIPSSATAGAIAAQEAAEAAQAACEQVLEDIPEDYSELSQDVADLKSAVDGIEEFACYKTLDQYPKNPGYLNNQKWLYTSGTAYKHFAIGVNPGDILKLTAGTRKTQIAFLRSYDTPVSGNYADFSEQTGYDNTIEISANATQTFTVPSDSYYLYVLALDNNNDASIVGMVVNGIDATKSTIENISVLSSRIGSNDEAISALQTENEKLNNFVYYKTVDAYPQDHGYISNGKWVYVQYTGYRHICVPVQSGDKITMVNGATSTQYAILKTYSAPVNGESLDFSTATGFTDKIEFSANAEAEFTVPADGAYFYLQTKHGGNSIVPDVVSINDLDITKNARESINVLEKTVSTVKDTVAAHTSQIQDLQDDTDFVKLSTRIARGLLSSTFVWNYCNTGAVYTHYHAEIPVSPGDVVSIKANASNTVSYIIFLKSYSAPVNSTSANPSEETGYTERESMSNGQVYNYTIPSDCHYLFILTTNNSVDVTPQEILINEVDVTKSIRENLSILHHKWDTDVNWVVMGDSIPSGYYSYMDGDTPTSGYNPKYAWTTLVAQMNHWTLTNISNGGAGYLKTGSGNTPAGYQIARATDYTPYNLVTIAYGTNDWSQSMPVGSMSDDQTAETLSGVIPAMRATIEAIIASNPYCKIIVILPLNRKYRTVSTEANDWALGTENENGMTLNQFCDLMIDVCEYYGIQYIDMAHSSIVNRKNIPTVLPDDVHPTIDCHKMLAHELSKRITF